MRFDPARFKGKKAAVLGLGRSGIACARLLLSRGFPVLASDSGPGPRGLKRLLPRAKIETGGHTTRRLLRCAFAVKSPGLNPRLPVFAALKKAGIPVFSELEVALAFSRADEVIAVSGTNGKSTTTALTGAVFKAGRPGRRVWVCGNIGIPISSVAEKTRPEDTLVIEASSYQLEDSQFFKPCAAALLNVTPDHLDHHGSLGAYVRAKAKLFSFQGPEEWAVLNSADPLSRRKIAPRFRGRRLFFGSRGSSAWVRNGRLGARLPGRPAVSLRPPALLGSHNLDNAMAAALLGLCRGIPPQSIQKAFSSFKPLEHRLEEFGAFAGLRCVNDSKATNVDSTVTALKAVEGQHGGKLFLVAGGLGKGTPYAPLAPFLKRGEKALLTIGSDASRLEKELSGNCPIFHCVELKKAVDTAFALARRGDMLLLSPACASFDQFRNFEHRGRSFKRLVRARAAASQ